MTSLTFDFLSIDYDKQGNSSGLPCPRECPCYRVELAAGDQLAYDSYGIPLQCPKIDMNTTLSTARNETSMAMGMEDTLTRDVQFINTFSSNKSGGKFLW